MTTVILIKDTNLSTTDTTRDMHTLFINQVRDSGLEGKIQVVRAADLGLYNNGVVAKVLPGGQIFTNLKEASIPLVIKAAQEGQGASAVPLEQMRIVLRNCGKIDPENISEYLAVNGYQALRKALFGSSPEKILEEMKASGLRGRGGAGYPAWMKWNLARNAFGEQKFIICNGDEGDPGAYMDRSILEGDPHSVIEGMMVASYVVGATRGFLYIRAEYPLAIQRVQRALDQAYEAGLLGKNILDSTFSFDLEVRLGAGAFVCGEETALIASIEGRRGTPRPRPPYPSDAGLWGKPTVINNVETLANVPMIIVKGSAWFSSIGTEKSKGTKVFALTGKIRNSGLVEIPMGTTLRDIVFGIGGGAAQGKTVVAVQTGGPSGGVIPEQHFDTPVSYEHLQELGSIMGSGGMIVMDQDDCMIDIVKFYLGFCVDESCGKCAPCKIGGYQMLKVLERVTDGKGEPADIQNLHRLSQAMQKASLCGLGQNTPNPVLSTLRFFEHIYQEHIVEKRCRSGKCTAMLTFEITETACKRCSLCFRNCPVNAISGDRDSGYVINQALCIKCGRCYEVCKFDAVARR